jgi:D-xylose transport system ATP-binding protein
VVIEARNITCYDADNPQRKRSTMSPSAAQGRDPRHRRPGRRRAHRAGVGHLRRLSRRVRGEVWLDGQKLDTATPLKAIRAGFALVPEDRKHHGIVPTCRSARTSR